MQKFSWHHLIGGFLYAAATSFVLTWLFTGLSSLVQRKGFKPKRMFIDYPPYQWFSIGTGVNDSRGREIVYSPIAFAYFVDYYRTARDPRRAAANKTLPPITFALDTLKNRNVFDQPIWHRGAPVQYQIRDVTGYGLRKMFPPYNLIKPLPGTAESPAWRMAAYALGTFVRHMRAGQARNPKLFNDMVNMGLRVSWETSELDRRIDKRLHNWTQPGNVKRAVKMMVKEERYQRTQDIVRRVENVFCPYRVTWDRLARKGQFDLGGIWDGSVLDDGRQIQAGEWTMAEIMEHIAAITEEENELAEKFAPQVQRELDQAIKELEAEGYSFE